MNSVTAKFRISCISRAANWGISDFNLFRKSFRIQNYASNMMFWHLILIFVNPDEALKLEHGHFLCAFEKKILQSRKHCAIVLSFFVIWLNLSKTESEANRINNLTIKHLLTQNHQDNNFSLNYRKSGNHAKNLGLICYISQISTKRLNLSPWMSTWCGFGGNGGGKCQLRNLPCIPMRSPHVKVWSFHTITLLWYILPQW